MCFRALTPCGLLHYAGKLLPTCLFAVLNPDDDKVYLIPVSEVGVTDVSLRLAPTLNNQTQGVRWAEFYLLKPLVLSGSGAMVAH